MTKKLLGLISTLLVILSFSLAWATLQVDYLETALSDGWQYDLMVFNDYNSDSNVTIFNIKFDFYTALEEKTVFMNSYNLPYSWVCYGCPSDDEFLKSIVAEVPFFDNSFLYEIAPQESKTFSFIFDSNFTAIIYSASLYDYENGETLPEVKGNATPVTEPATLALVSVGLAGMGLYTRRKRIHSIEG
jgi:hypothetical protein